MITLKENYQKNLEVLKENLERGMSLEMAQEVVSAHEKQFIKAGLYKKGERDYIQAMQNVLNKHFNIKIERASDFMKSLGVDVINIE